MKVKNLDPLNAGAEIGYDADVQPAEKWTIKPDKTLRGVKGNSSRTLVGAVFLKPEKPQSIRRR
ncbi:hypothetical protein ACO22_05451 [Paracoccidioides brasiliensis]|uniref:Uncharacterized protein n=1 Tax=Paracoccidioides brasiliensis TaxID=121759 RepID=A0A1D2JA95_PARBR|nr:hypothetical protein ACO22_05451 [Paracoccidioides brasiliensis]